MSALLQLAKMFRVGVDDVDAVMRSERGYRAAISRRNLFAAGAALAAGSVLVGGPLPVLLHVYSDDCEFYIGETLEQALAARIDYMGEDADPERFEQMPDHHFLGIWADDKGIITTPDDGAAEVMELRASDWARRIGYGFLCTTEF